MARLFGTDGIRGRAGEYPLDEKTVKAIGSSIARVFRDRLGRSPMFVSGRDTRESGEWIEAGIHSGIVSEGVSCRSAEVITTPGVAYLAKALKADAGIVISASHNPYHDNGIKIFLPSGQKLEEAAESEIEKHLTTEQTKDIADAGIANGDATRYRMTYSLHLATIANKIAPNRIKIVIDCANGAASGFARKTFKRCGGGVVLINSAPNGRNINENCGSLHLEQLQREVVAQTADLGVAFDGDADRALFVDHEGNIVDGDATLWIMANFLRSHGDLTNGRVVATVMSNIGLELALKSVGVELVRTPVGDKYVLDELVRTGSDLGGEQSGHIIFPKMSLVGDGMMTALMLIRAMVESQKALSELARGFVRYPQVLVNVKVLEKRPFDDVPAIDAAANAIERELNGSGRLLLRYSGTENLARVMIEGRDQASIEQQANMLADVIRANLG